jgi:hypothetical protein
VRSGSCLKAKNYAEGSKPLHGPDNRPGVNVPRPVWMKIIAPVRRPDLLLYKKNAVRFPFLLHALIFYRPGQEFLQDWSCKMNPDVAVSTLLRRRSRPKPRE